MDQNMSNNIPATCPDFGLHDFITESNFDQFLDLIVGDHERSGVVRDDENLLGDYGCGYGGVDVGQQMMIGDEEVERLLRVEIESHFNDDHHQPGYVMDCPQTDINADHDLFGFGHLDNGVGCGDHEQLDQFMGNALLDIDDVLGQVGDGQLMHHEDQDEDDEEEEYDNCNDGSVSSGTTTPSKKGKSDRSRTLISERRRRGRMKDNLYALRALVPNITKMDKASIVGDAVLYVQNLQVKAKTLKSEIAELEASVARQGLNGKPSTKKSHATATRKNMPTPVSHIITKMDVFQVGEGEFYIKVISNKGLEIAPCLYKALESLHGGFKVQSTNLSTVLDTYVLTFTLHVRDGGGEMMNVLNLKVWLSRALTSQGFILKLSPC